MKTTGSLVAGAGLLTQTVHVVKGADAPLAPEVDHERWPRAGVAR